jgi:rubrerythrin
MSDLFHVREAIDFAVTIERHGHEFYTEAKKKFADPQFQSLFGFLADEEVKHEKTFKELARDLRNYTPRESYEGEYEAYTREFLKSHSLANREILKEKLAALETMEDAIDMALHFERDSIVFFSSLKRYVGDRKEKLEEIVQEEVNHIVRIKAFRP